METPERIDIDDLIGFTPKQQLALQKTRKFRYTFFGGGMGGGKSYWLRWVLVWWLLRVHAKKNLRGVVAGLFSEDFPVLKDRHISKIETEFPPWLGRLYNDHKQYGLSFVLRPEYGGGVIALRNLDDPSKYQSSEFAYIAIDEAQKNPVGTFRTLRRRLRWPGIPNTRMFLGGNPGEEPWVRQFFVDKVFPPEEEEADEFTFVQSLATDNPHLEATYRRQLESMPEAERRAFLEGQWDAFDVVMDPRGYMRILSDPEIRNAITDEVRHAGNGILSVDVGAGGDRTSVVYRTRTAAEVLFHEKTRDTMSVVPIIASAWEISGHRAAVCVDSVGVGKGVFDRLKEIRSPDGREMEVRGIAFGGRPADKSAYFDRKAELYWNMRAWILGGGRLIPHDGWNDLAAIKYRVNSERVIRIQPKDELRRAGIASPDAVDALVMSFADEIETDVAGHPFHDKMVDVWRHA